MNKKTVRWAILYALLSHGVGLLLLLLLTAVGVKLENPSAAVLPVVFSSLFAGAILCGILLRRQGDVLASILGSLLFGALPLIVSFFGKNTLFGIGARLLVMLGLTAVSLAVAFLFPKSGRKRRRKSHYRR